MIKKKHKKEAWAEPGNNVLLAVWGAVCFFFSTFGISDFAQDALGDVVFLELPETGTQVAEGDDVCVIESVKAASDILAPVEGEIVEVNEALAENPGKVNEDAMGQWFFKMKVEDLSVIDQFMDEDEYKALID